MTVSSVCPKCGTIGKSGKSSCCGRGGSWYRNCGNAGNEKAGHTWYEGVQACNTRSGFKTVIGKQQNAAQQPHSRQGDGKSVVIVISTPTSSVASVSPSVRTAINKSVATSVTLSMGNTSTSNTTSTILFLLYSYGYLCVIIFTLLQAQ